MIALYFLVVIIFWFIFTLVSFVLIWKFAKRIKFKTSIKTSAVFCIYIAWLFISFWFAGGRTFYYDWKVDKMCAVDGGNKVYEQVKFKDDKEVLEGYELKMQDYVIKTGNPMIVKSEYIEIRKRDNKIMSKLVNYNRRGGCFPDPFGIVHGCGYSCKNISYESTFIKE